MSEFQPSERGHAAVRALLEEYDRRAAEIKLLEGVRNNLVRAGDMENKRATAERHQADLRLLHADAERKELEADRAALSSLLRGMARRVGLVRFERRTDLMAALDGAVREMNAARARVAAVRALADELDPPSCREHQDDETGTPSGRRGCPACDAHRVATIGDVAAGRRVRAVLDGSTEVPLVSPKQSQTPDGSTDTPRPKAGDRIEDETPTRGEVRAANEAWRSCRDDINNALDQLAAVGCPPIESDGISITLRRYLALTVSTTPDPAATSLSITPTTVRWFDATGQEIQPPKGGYSDEQFRRASDAVARCFAADAEVAPTRSREFYNEIAHSVLVAALAGTATPDPTPLAAAARDVLAEWSRMHPSGHLAMYGAMDALRRAVRGQAPSPPGYPRIADAITTACEAADIDLTVVHDGRVLDYVPGVTWLATVLDKAGLIDWAAFTDEVNP